MAHAAMSSPGPAYRLATATSAKVTATLHVVGTLTPVRQSDIAFPVGGTVTSVTVRPGQQVTAGQTLGSLDTTPLKADLTAAQSTLATANLQVDNGTASQTTTTPSTSPAARPAPSVRPLQQAVLGAQRKVDSTLALARAALSQARHACTPPSSPSPTTKPTVTAPATRAATAAPAGTGPPAPAPGPAACAGATQRVLDAETAVLQAQQALSGQLTALNTALTSAAATASKSAGAGGAGSTVRGTGRGGTSGGPVSAARLAADQASADAAAAQVTVAQANLAGATVVSPIDGTVVTASVTPGASAAAGGTRVRDRRAGQLPGGDHGPRD